MRSSAPLSRLSDGEKRFTPFPKQDTRKPQGGRSFLSEVTENTDAKSFGTDAKSFGPKCPLCEGKHELDSCPSFLGKSLHGRKAFVKEHKLCFGCLVMKGVLNLSKATT